MLGVCDPYRKRLASLNLNRMNMAFHVIHVCNGQNRLLGRATRVGNEQRFNERHMRRTKGQQLKLLHTQPCLPIKREDANELMASGEACEISIRKECRHKWRSRSQSISGVG